MEERQLKEKLMPHIGMLIFEAVIRSIVLSVLCGGIAYSFSIIIEKLFCEKPYYMATAIIISVLVVFVAIFFYFMNFQPDIMEIARRVDKTGLDERIITMLENYSSNESMSDMQRNNAIYSINNISSYKKRKMKFEFNISEFRNIFIALIIAVLLSFIPFKRIPLFWIPVGITNQVNKKEQEAIDNMMKDLEKTIKESELDDKTKSELLEELKELEESINQKGKSTMEKIAEISEFQDKVQKLIDEYRNSKNVGQELQTLDETDESKQSDEGQNSNEGEGNKDSSDFDDIGEALEKNDKAALKKALGELEDKLNGLEGEEKKEALENAASDIKDALDNLEQKRQQNGDNSGKSEIEKALEELSNDFEAIAKEVSESDSKSDEVSEAIGEAESKISENMDEQSMANNVNSQMQEIMEKAKQEILAASAEEQGEQGEQNGEQQGEQNGEQQGQQGEQQGQQESGQSGEQQGEEDSQQPSEQQGEQQGQNNGNSQEGQGYVLSSDGQTWIPVENSGGGSGPSDESTDGSAAVPYEEKYEVYTNEDGKIPYKDIYGSSYTEALEELYDKESTDDVSNSVEEYFDSLK